MGIEAPNAVILKSGGKFRRLRSVRTENALSESKPHMGANFVLRRPVERSGIPTRLVTVKPAYGDNSAVVELGELCAAVFFFAV